MKATASCLCSYNIHSNLHDPFIPDLIQQEFSKMSASFTFSSVGDIIAICQIFCALGRALGDSRRYAQEYREPYARPRDRYKNFNAGGLFRGRVRPLRSVDGIQVVALWQTCASSPQMEELNRCTKLIVNQCSKEIIEFRLSFTSRNSTKIIRDYFRKIEWMATQKMREAANGH